MLSKTINNFTTRAHKEFSNYQPSGMEMLEFHLVEQLTENLRVVRSKKYLHACLYNTTYTESKESHKTIYASQLCIAKTLNKCEGGGIISTRRNRKQMASIGT